MQIENAISNARIIVRNYLNTDLSFVTGMWFDEENGKYLSDPTKEYVDDVYQKALEKMENSSDGYYLVIETKDTQRPIGSCCIFPDEKKEAYDIGYCIHKDYWKQGYGTDTIFLVKEWIREHGEKEITAEVAKDNLASNLLLKKFGFKIKRESKFKKYNMDVHYDSYIYSLALR